MCTNTAYAIYCHPSFGPSFGCNDIRIMSSSNSNQHNFSYFGNSYKHVDYQEGTEKAKTILAGSHYFQTHGIEVFVLIN